MSDVILTGRITALEPLHIGTGIKLGNFLPTLDYIPARAIRGMLGNYLYSTNRSLFDELKLSEDNRPIVFFKPGIYEGFVRAPMLLRACKCCEKILGQNVDECPDCKQDGKEMEGWIERSWKIGERVKKHGSIKTTNTKCPIMPTTHTSPPKDADLAPYNVEALHRNTRFEFRIVLPEKYAKDVKTAMQEAGVLYGVGGFRSRGYGSVYIEFEREENVEKYEERRKKEIEKMSTNGLLLILNTPAVMKMDEHGEIFSFRKEDFSRYLNKIGFTNPQVVVERQKVKVTIARGWTICGTSRLDVLYPALAEGSSCKINLSPEIAVHLEVYGVGFLNHIYGDVYFRGL